MEDSTGLQSRSTILFISRGLISRYMVVGLEITPPMGALLLVRQTTLHLLYLTSLCIICFSKGTYTYVGTDRSLSISGQKSSSYRYFSRCVWAIYTDEENIIQLTFDRMSMRSNYYSYCRTAYVQVIDGGSYTGTTIGTYCSDQGKTVFSTRNRLLIIFYSGGYYDMDSFEATVRARKGNLWLPLECGQQALID